MPSIEEYTRANFPETYDNIVNNYASAEMITLMISRTMAELFVAGTDVSAIDSFEAVKAYVADAVTLNLAPTAIDMWQTKAIVSDSTKGEGVSYYDRVDGIIALCDKIKARMNPATLASQVPDLIDPSLNPIPAIPKISTDGQGFKTDDPNLYEITDQVEDLGGETEVG